jgi:hypothetical protein
LEVDVPRQILTPPDSVALERPGPWARPEAAALRQRLALLALNVLGGAAVLASYAWGALGRPEAMGALWGGVPEAARGLYTLNMFLAAAGYFLFTPYVLLRLDPARTRVAGRFGYRSFASLYALVLLPSALWLPLTVRMLDSPSLALWWAIRVDLGLVGLGATGLLVALLALGAGAPRGRALAVLGLLPFCLQTAVLDALVWPLFFPLPRL